MSTKTKRGKTKKAGSTIFGYVQIQREGVTDVSPPSPGQDISCINLISPDHHSLLVAKAHHTYDVRFQIIGGFVRVLLLDHPKYIPSSAIAYSLKLKDDLYAMPIGGYSVILGK